MTKPHILAAAILAWLAPLSIAVGQGLPSSGISARAQEMVATWRADLAVARARQASLPPPVDVAEDLSRRAELDVIARQGVTQFLRSDLSTPDKGLALQRLFEDIGRIDAENTAALRRSLPAEGWFKPSVDGAKLAQDAWLIVQHSPDPAFRVEVLGRMETLLSSGDVNPRDYALLYDRVRTEKKQPQRFASQAQCMAGKWTFHALEDATAVDARRRAVGWTETLPETEKRLRIGSTC